MKHELPPVRIATPKDEPAVMSMCHRLWEENGLFSYNEDKVRDVIRKCYKQEGSIVGVIEKNGTIEASTCLVISDFYYSSDWHLAELWNFVDAPYRRSYNAEALIEFGKACSDKMKIPYFTGIITCKQMAGKVRLYRRSLGYPTGAFFLYGSNWKSEPLQDNLELRQRLKEFARVCNETKIPESRDAVCRHVAPVLKNAAVLLREAAEAIGGEDDIWSAAKPVNGAGSQVKGAA